MIHILQPFLRSHPIYPHTTSIHRKRSMSIIVIPTHFHLLISMLVHYKSFLIHCILCSAKIFKRIYKKKRKKRRQRKAHRRRSREKSHTVTLNPCHGISTVVGCSLMPSRLHSEAFISRSSSFASCGATLSRWKRWKRTTTTKRHTLHTHKLTHTQTQTPIRKRKIQF